MTLYENGTVIYLEDPTGLSTLSQCYIQETKDGQWRNFVIDKGGFSGIRFKVYIDSLKRHGWKIRPALSGECLFFSQILEVNTETQG